ncbi:MAG: D-2-hydroxyacid dehydrogenase [Halobacteriales archaeon]|nr:D-2-hydroxyacid dehydrogenase [Halobacteriales archaeon]
MSDPDVVVLRRDVHGMAVSGYVEALRERLPDREVAHATTPTEERELVAGAPVVTGLDLRNELLDAAGELELFQCLYAGTDHLPMEELAERGVTVTNASGVHGPPVAEWVLGMMLSFARRLHEGARRQDRREWRHYQAGELAGSTVTVVGLGHIGQAVVQRLAGFDVETIGVRYTPEKGGPTDEVVGFDDAAFHGALARTDYLVLACPLTGRTEGLIDAAALETLPPRAVLVNVARGAVVDTEALLAELRGQGLAGAALDVTDPEPLPEDHPLWTLDNVRVTPHVAGHTPRYYERVADVLAGNLAIVDERGAYDGLENQVSP